MNTAHRDPGPAYISPAEARRRTGLSTDTLGRLADRGDLRTIRTPGGHRRYSTASINALIAEAAQA